MVYATTPHSQRTTPSVSDDPLSFIPGIFATANPLDGATILYLRLQQSRVIPRVIRGSSYKPAYQVLPGIPGIFRRKYCQQDMVTIVQGQVSLMIKDLKGNFLKPAPQRYPYSP